MARMAMMRGSVEDHCLRVSTKQAKPRDTFPSLCSGEQRTPWGILPLLCFSHHRASPSFVPSSLIRGQCV